MLRINSSNKRIKIYKKSKTQNESRKNQIEWQKKANEKYSTVTRDQDRVRKNIHTKSIYTIPLVFRIFGAFFDQKMKSKNETETKESEKKKRNEDCQQSRVTATEHQKYKTRADC